MDDEELKGFKGKPLLHVLKRLQQANQSFTIRSDDSSVWDSGVEIWLSNGSKLKFDPETQQVVQDDSTKDKIGQTAVNKNDRRNDFKVFKHPCSILERSFFIEGVEPVVRKNNGIMELKFFKKSLTKDQNKGDSSFIQIKHNCTKKEITENLGNPDSEEKYDDDSLMSYFDLGLAFVMTSEGKVKYFRLFSGLPGYNTFGLFQHCPFNLTLRKKRGNYMLSPNTRWNDIVCDDLDPKPKRVWPKLEKPTSMASNNAIDYFKLPGMVLSVSTVSDTVASVTLFKEDDEKMKDFWLSTPPSDT